ASRGGMSLKTTPALGKSGMSRIRSLSRGTSGSTTQGYRPGAHGASPPTTLLPRTGSGGTAGTTGRHRAGRHPGRTPGFGGVAVAGGVGRVEDPAAGLARPGGPAGAGLPTAGCGRGIGGSGHRGRPTGELLAEGGGAGFTLLQ